MVVACAPHPGYGNVAIQRGALVQHVDLTTCRRWTTATKFVVPTLTVEPDPPRGEDDILYRGHVIYSSPHRNGPIELFGLSPDKRWALFAIDPQGSASLAADGLTLEAVSVEGGGAHVVASGLLSDDYRTWCRGKLVMTAGGDRVTTHNKWLIVTGPPGWHARVLLRDPNRAFASLACDGDSVVVQEARATGLDESLLRAHWSLWRVRITDGKTTVLDTPPRGASDDSPRVARDGRIVFVRSRGDHGVLTVLGGGPLLDLGSRPAYYGHRAWPFTWSLQRR